MVSRWKSAHQFCAVFQPVGVLAAPRCLEVAWRNWRCRRRLAPSPRNLVPCVTSPAYRRGTVLKPISAAQALRRVVLRSAAPGGRTRQTASTSRAGWRSRARWRGGAPFAKGHQVQCPGRRRACRSCAASQGPRRANWPWKGWGRYWPRFWTRSTPSGETEKPRLAPSSFSSSTTGPLRMSSASAARALCRRAARPWPARRCGGVEAEEIGHRSSYLRARTAGVSGASVPAASQAAGFHLQPTAQDLLAVDPVGVGGVGDLVACSRPARPGRRPPSLRSARSVTASASSGQHGVAVFVEQHIDPDDFAAVHLVHHGQPAAVLLGELVAVFAADNASPRRGTAWRVESARRLPSQSNTGWRSAASSMGWLRHQRASPRRPRWRR